MDYFVYTDIIGEAWLSKDNTILAEEYNRMVFKGTKYECGIYLKGFVNGQFHCNCEQ